ncbi:MAG: hypothetical protein IJ446_05125 [Oscillospiraceae bacterium]|nr:hypothetical protein [Oscillospiraceae bacterium]
MIKKILCYVGTFAAALLFLWGALLLSSSVPDEKIYDNLYSSAQHYSGKMAFGFKSDGRYNSVTDNYADVILLNIIYNIKSNDPFISSLDTKYYSGGEEGVNAGFYYSLTEGIPPDTDYTRYWHGMAVFIRPLLIFTDVEGIKNIGAWAVMLLMAALCVILTVKKQYFGAAAVIISFSAVQLWNIRLSLEYLPSAAVCFFMSILYVLLEKKSDDILIYLSICGGVMIAFFDFLTAETLTILIPLLLVYIIRMNDGRTGELKSMFRTFFLNCIAWGISYIMTFIAKWTIASAVTGENKFTAALSSVGERFAGEADKIGYPKLILYAPLANLSTVFGGTERISSGNIIVGLAVTAVVMCGVYYILRRKVFCKEAVIFAVIAVIPFIRFSVLSNHSYLHEFFTYRALASSVMALLAFVWYNILLSENKKTVSGNKKSIKYKESR